MLTYFYHWDRKKDFYYVLEVNWVYSLGQNYYIAYPASLIQESESIQLCIMEFLTVVAKHLMGLGRRKKKIYMKSTQVRRPYGNPSCLTMLEFLSQFVPASFDPDQ